MTLDRRQLLTLAAGALLAGGGWGVSQRPAHAASGARDILEAELASGRPCASEATAIRKTLSRMMSMSPPRNGRTIVVDLPSQTLSCYEDSSVVLQSRVVVGDTDWETPDLSTTAAFVRFNPTWTVPESILKSRDWRGRLASDPYYFEKLGFEVELDGRMVSPRDASHRARQVGRFVLVAGSGNALGEVKIGLNAGNAIYLHDTNDRSAFAADMRTMSHGCIRVEEAIAVAAWVLGIDPYEAQARVDEGDTTDYRSLPSPVRVATTYFTAWPDEYGTVRYWPDVYGRDGTGSRYCSEQVTWQSPDSGRVDAVPSDIIVIGN